MNLIEDQITETYSGTDLSGEYKVVPVFSEKHPEFLPINPNILIPFKVISIICSAKVSFSSNKTPIIP